MSRAVLLILVIALALCDHAGMTAATGARARVRAELTEEILAAGRRQLAEHGSAALSLRALHEVAYLADPKRALETSSQALHLASSLPSVR